MISVTLTRITDLVGLRLDEFPDCRTPPSPATSRSATLAEMIEPLIEGVALRLTLGLPIGEFTAPSDMRAHIRAETDWGEEGYAEVRLPDDFCRLHSLRMTGWGQTLSADNPGHPVSLALGDSAPAWATANPLYSWVHVYSRDDTRVMRFGPVTSPLPVCASYIPRPRYNRDSSVLTGLDPALLLPLAESLAEWLPAT